MNNTNKALQPQDDNNDAKKPESVEFQKLCRACKSPMPIDANKCIECSSWQNWKRYLNSSSTFLGLLVALVSVLTFAIPIWKDTLTPNITLPTPMLVDVNDSGYATFIITNAGKQPSVLEYIVFGTNGGVLSFDLQSIQKYERIIQKQDISVFKAKLDVKNSEDSIWELVKMYRDQNECIIQAGIISPEGERKKSNVNVSKAGLNESEKKELCPFKLKKLIINTIGEIDKKPEYVKTLCKVVKMHPKDPDNPIVPPGCKQFYSTN